MARKRCQGASKLKFMENLKEANSPVDLKNLSEDQVRKLEELKTTNDGPQTDEVRWEAVGIAGAKRFVANRKSVIENFLKQ